jgi:hypothetical protein
MGFEVVEAGQFRSAGLAEGECSLGKGGALVVRADDLQAVGITNYAVVLCEVDSRRIGLRAVRDGEQQSSMACSIVANSKKEDGGRRRIGVARAIKRLNLTPEAVAARDTLHTLRDELLFISLDEVKHVPPNKPFVPPAKPGTPNAGNAAGRK